ncbi:MAG: adenylate/guanylate cyclase domain-containing protein [Actinomycetota bacterium]|nr:adenylate/guanylate cyclase domain-containing protein [Actinomycetota bacterium]
MQPEHASRLAAAWVADPAAPPWRELHGSAVLTDISGFTRLTERLTYGGAEGPEVLHAAICAALTTLLGPAIEAHGDIIGFAGDSALVWFDADEHPDHAELAVQVASRMPRDITALPAAMSGGRRLRVSVGVHTGMVQGHLVGAGQVGLFLCGPDVSTLVALQTQAQPGQVLMSAATAAQAAPTWSAAPVGDAFAVRPRRRAPGSVQRPATTAGAQVALPAACAALLGPTVRELIAAGPTHGDFRNASFGFVKVWGLDGIAAREGGSGVHTALAHVVELVTRVAAEEAVEWLDVSPGVDSTSLLLSAGAPRSIEHDEDQMLIVLRRLVDECEVPVSAGAQRGRVFSGMLGVPGHRRYYTVMGDAVNVGARALGLAAPGEVVVGDGMAVNARRSFVHSTALGPQALRNRVRPAEMWRVTGVGPRPVRRRAVVEGGSGWLRRDEAMLLAGAWKHTVDRRGRVVSVIGEPGMGASGLLADTVALAGGAATSVVPDAQRQQVPYAGLAAIVGELAGTLGSEVRSTRDGWAWLGGFADRLPPHVREWVAAALATAEQRDVHDLDPLSAAQRARIALAALVLAAAPRPWLLAIDDVELMDEASRQVIARVCASAGDERVMVLVGHRPGTEPLDPSATSGDDLLAVQLGPLADDQAAQLVIDSAPSLRDDVVARIVAAGAGNPFVLSELARTPIDGELPDSLQRLGAWLLDALPAKTRALVRDVSILGATVPVALAVDVLGRPELADRQVWAAAAPVLRLAADGTVAFGHEAYRRVAYDTLPFQRRRALHAAVADHLAGMRDASDAVRATHLELAGRAGEAYPLAAAAGRTAKAAGALTEAVDLLVRAAAMARVHDPSAVAGLLMDEAEARGWLADHGAMELALRAARRATTDPLVIGRICHLRADLALRHDQFAAAKRWASRGMAATAGAAAAGDPSLGELRCFLLLDLGAVRDLSDDHLGSVPIYGEALQWAASNGSRLMEGLAHTHIEMAYSSLMDPRAIAHGDAAVRIFTELGHHRYLQHALTNSGLTAMYMGRWNDAIERYQRAIEGYERYGHALGAATAVSNVGFLRFRQGRLHEADERGRQAIRVYEAAGVPHNAATPRLLRAHVAAAEGRFADAAALVAEARAAFAAVDRRSMVLDCDVSTMEHLVLAGRYAEAAAAGAALADREVAAPELRVTYDRVLGRAEVALGTTSGVARVERALAAARELNVVYEVLQCLATLVAIADAGGPAVAPSVPAELEGIRRSLGVVA